MNPRLTWRWLLLAAALAVAVVVQHRYFRKTEIAPVKILPQLRPDAVTSVQVLLGPLEIQAERTNSGGWSLTRPIVYPAQATGIEVLLAKLARLTPAVRIDANELKNRPRADEEFGFASPQASVVIRQGEELMRLLLGGLTSPGDQLYLRLDGVEAVYVVDADLLKLVPRSANEWRETVLLNLKDLAFDRLAITNGGKMAVEFQRESTNAAWQMLHPLQLRADSSRIDRALEKLQSTRVSQFISEDPKADLEGFGLRPPELELTFGQGTNILARLQFGKTNEAGQVYSKRPGLDTVVTVSNELVSPWRSSVNEFRAQHLISPDQPVESIEISGQEKFSLQRQTNDSWRVLPQNIVADASLVADLLAVLSGAPIDFVQDNVTDSGLTEYGLTSPIRRYILRSSPVPVGEGTNRPLAELLFGSQKGNRVFVRRTDESAVYGISVADFERLPASSWQFRERRLWNFGDEEIAGATIRKEGKTCQIVRKDRYKWSFAPGSQGIIKNELALEETIRGLARATAAAWVARGEQHRARFGFNPGSLQVALDLKSGEKASVEFGGAAPSALEYAAVTFDGQLWIFEFPSPLFRDVMNALPIP